MACGKYHWAGGCAQSEIDRTFATFERAYVLAVALWASEFAKILRNARLERGTDR